MKNDENTAAPRRAGGAARTLLIGSAVLLLLAGGGLAGMLLGNRTAESPAGSAAEARPQKPALYASLLPPLVVNFRDSGGDSHYMQVTLDVMSREPAVIEAVKQHSAAIRNGLILLFSDSVDYASVNTREHKERMLEDALTEIRKVLRERTGNDAVEAVYFTSLIVQ